MMEVFVTYLKVGTKYRILVYGSDDKTLFSVFGEPFEQISPYPLFYSIRLVEKKGDFGTVVPLERFVEIFIQNHCPEYQRRVAEKYIPFVPTLYKHFVGKIRR